MAMWRHWLLMFALWAACIPLQAGPPLPGFYQTPGLSPGRATVSGNVAERIDPFTGMLQIHQTDDVLPGAGGFDLALQRSYNSPSGQFGTVSDTQSYNRTPDVGVGWNLLIGGRAFNVSDTGGGCSGGAHIIYETPDGGRQALLRQIDGTFLSAARWRGICMAGGVQIYAPDGTRYDLLQQIVESIPVAIALAPFYYPTRIEDRNGNYATFNYVTSGAYTLLDNITTSDGRAVSFGYMLKGSRQLLATVSTSGRTWAYSYYDNPSLPDEIGGNGQYSLKRVEPPAGGHWEYDYYLCNIVGAGKCAMATLTYPTGGYIVYTYASKNFNDGSGDAIVVATKGVGGTTIPSFEGNLDWTFAYTPGSAGVPDVTEVTSFLGKTTYKHVGHSTVIAGDTWQIGLLVEKKTQDAASSNAVIETETLAWDKQQISTYPTIRAFGNHDMVTYAPLLQYRVVNRNGATYATTFSNWDAYGNPQSVVEAGERSRTTTRTYFVDSTKWIVNVLKDETITGAGSITRSFDTKANLTNETRFGVSTSYTYDGVGNVASRTDARGFTTYFSNYLRGIAQQEDRPEAVSIVRTVDTHGNVTSQTDGAAHVYQYGYDAARRIVSRVPPIGLPTSTAWTGSIQSDSTRGSYTEVQLADGLGYPLKTTRQGIPSIVGHNAKGQRTLESLPGGVTEQGTVIGHFFPRDNLGRIRYVQDPIGGQRTLLHQGGGVSETDQKGRTTGYAYAAFGEPDKRFLTGISFPDNTSMTIGRDDLGNVTSATRGSLTRTYGYNGSYYLTSMVDPETGTTTFGRDNLGNMTSRTVAGQTTTFTYDGLNRLTGVAYPGGGTVAITYLGNGRTATVTTPQTSWTYGYDANANLTSETLVVGGYTFAIGYSYNGNDALSTITYPRTGEVVTYSPDPLGRPTLASPFVTSVSYFDSGNIKDMVFANGVKTTNTETARQWPEYTTVSSAGANPLDYVKSVYGYDAVGNVSQIIDYVTLGRSKQMAYDSLDQLTKTVGHWGEINNHYDGVGNLTEYTIAGSVRSYTYGTDNKLATFAGRTFTHDSYGNVTSDGRHAYQYDHASNLTCVDCGTQNEITYLYDGNNRRVARMQAGVTTYYVTASNGDLLLEYTPSTNKAIEHIYLRGKRVASKTVTN